jgi:predicted RNA binding protein YcfA (HicA-like mRNA interferase family)
MGRFEKLLQRATEAPGNLRFSDLCTLAEMAGFVFDRAGGSHKIYKHPAGGMMNFQDVNGKAKPYQVKQLLDYIRQNSGE